MTASERDAGCEADPATVWLVEDNALYRSSLASAIGDAPGLVCGLDVPSCEAALAALSMCAAPDIVLMDIGLPGMSGIEGTRRMRGLAPACRVVMLTVHEEDEKVFAALCAGASGYLLKSATADHVVQAIREVSRGAAPINGYIAAKVLGMLARLPEPPSGSNSSRYGLTAREREILQLLVEGLSMKQVAARLAVSYHTIDSHQRSIYDKLHVHSRSGAVAKALRERLI